MLNQKEVRYLLIDEIWPDDYYDEELFIQSEKIMLEWDAIRGDNSMAKLIKEKDFEINRNIKLHVLRSIYRIFYLNETIAKELIKEHGLKYTKASEIERAIKQREFDIQVQAAKQEAKETGKKDHTFEELCIPIERHFKIVIDRDITVAKFVAWENRLKKENG